MCPTGLLACAAGPLALQANAPTGSRTPSKRTYALFIAHWRDYRWTALVHGDAAGRTAWVEWHNHVGGWCTKGCGRSWPETSVAEAIELVREWRTAVVSYLTYVNGPPQLVDTVVAAEGDLAESPGVLDERVMRDPRYSLSAWVRTRRSVPARSGTLAGAPVVPGLRSQLATALLRWKARWR